MAERRAFANVDFWEHRADRSYDEQDGTGLLHPNGTQLVSFDHDFLGAATRELLEAVGECPAGGDHNFQIHDESPQGPRRVVHCTECDATPTTEIAS